MARSYSAPSRIPVVVSAAVTTSSNSGNLKNKVNALPICDAVTLILDVTAHAQTTAFPAFRVYLDTSPDGTNWYPALLFATVTTSTDIQRWEGRLIGVGTSETATLTRVGTGTQTTTVSTVAVVLTPDHRIRWEFLANATATSATFALWALCQNSASYGE